jgi:branched-subunit amino acid ABC-type transport system permease component
VRRFGAPLPLAVLCGAAAAGLAGVVIERLVVRRLYGRPLDTIVATWGISLIAAQGTLILLGPSLPGIGTPLGSVTVGAYSYSVYRLVLMAVAVLLLAALYLLFNATRFGMLALALLSRYRTWRLRSGWIPV